jgi:5-dehydro-2-deoxygluconokinase
VRDLIRSNDPLIRDVIVPEQTSGSDAIPAALGAAATEPAVKAFALDRGISREPALCRLAEALDDGRFGASFVANNRGYINTWQTAKDRS